MAAARTATGRDCIGAGTSARVAKAGSSESTVGLPERRSAAAHAAEELVDLVAQSFGLAGELAGRGQDHVGGATGLVGAARHAGDVGGHGLCALGRLLYVSGDVSRRRRLLLDGRRDAGSATPHA